MATPPDLDKANESKAQGVSGDGETRRRLLRGGVIGAPIVLSLASSRVMGATNPYGQCQSVSSFGSLNLSRPANTVPCTGRSPGYWKNHPGNWPAGCIATTAYGTPTTFASVFGTNPLSAPSGVTLFAVIYEPYATWSTDLSRAVVAAYLNAKSGKVPLTILPIATIQAMWTACRSGGLYSVPASSISWTSAQVVSYLQSTYD
ncbi:MAG: hypothetical protein ACKVQQ_20190 [Burkholderiales bacterium]